MRIKYKAIVLQWIPSHCGIPGNEKANELAKKGRSVDQVPYNLISYRSISSKNNQRFRITHITSLKDRTKEKSWKNAILPDCPRSIAVAAVRLPSKHDCHMLIFTVLD